MESVDQIIHARWVLPIIPRDTVLEHHAVAIRDGRILALVPSAEAAARFAPSQEFSLPEHLLMPGLVNAHGHAAMTLLRGLADDHSLMTWLREHIWPAEARWVGEEFVHAGTMIAIAEMLMSGTTCFSDMYFFPDAVAAAAVAAGLRAQIAFPILDHPSAWAADGDEYLAKGLQVRDRFKSNPRLSFAFGPHAPYTTGNQTLERVAMLSAELDAPVQMHLHETEDEVRESISQFGHRPLARLDAIGLLSPRMQAVHMTQIDSQDMELLARNGAHVVHCPASNLKLAAGFCPVRRLLAAGVNVSLGTDGAASNNTLDLFAEARLAALLAKGSSGDPTALSAHEAVRMATLRGAECLGLAERIGSVEPGKDADLIAVHMARLDCGPLYDLHSALVYTTSGPSVTHAWVEGRLLLDERRLTEQQPAVLRELMREWRTRIVSP